MTSDDNPIDLAGKQAAYITNEWTDDPAIMQTQALCYVGYQLGRIADQLGQIADALEAGNGDETE
jgi:hypothetical protein